MNCPTGNTPIDEHQATLCVDAWVSEAVMGISLLADTPEKIAMAVFDASVGSDGRGHADFTWNGTRYRQLDLIRSDLGITNYEYGWSFWTRRSGELWQSDLEGHVDKWRALSRPYSTEIAAVWEILLHFTPYGSFSFFLHRWYTDNGNWHCDYAGIKATSTAQQGAPLAICRAALKAVEHERTIRNLA